MFAATAPPAIAFSAGAVVVAAIFLVAMTSNQAASAEDSYSCMNQADPIASGEDDYGQIDARESDSSDTKLRGVRSSMHAATSAECQRISSVIVDAPTGNGTFEFGWMMGWWGPSICTPVDFNHFYTRPTLFNVHITRSGNYGCTFWPHIHPTKDAYDTYQVSDTNGNTWWGSYYGGQALQPGGVNMDFSMGRGVVNMERGHSNDGGHAVFNDINEYHDSNGWTDFDHLTTFYDVDQDFDMHILSGHRGDIY